MIHSPTPSDRFSAAKHPSADEQRKRERRRRPGGIGREQQRRAGAGALAAPRPSESSPRTGPAHGAHSRPVATPSSREAVRRAVRVAGAWSADWDSRAPRPTSGCIRRSDSAGNSSATPNSASRAIDSQAAILVGLDGPPAADGRQGGDRRERRGHARRAAAIRCGRTADPPARTRKAARAGCTG